MSNAQEFGAKVTSRAEELKALAIELAELVMESAKMDKIRAEEKGQWEIYIAEMEKGLNGMKLALKVLNEYYQLQRQRKVGNHLFARSV